MRLTHAVSFVTVAAVASVASAGPSFTTVQSPSSGELSHGEILGDLYGGVWSLNSDGLTLSNGDLTAQRVADSITNPASVGSGFGPTGDDQLWRSGAGTVTARAVQAADQHTFGVIGASGAFVGLTDTRAFGTSVEVDQDSEFRWALRDRSTNTTLTSVTGDNARPWRSARDQLVTYSILGLDDRQDTWLLFWEDRAKGFKQWSDYDFNDAVIEVKAVPTPGALGVLALSGAFGATRRRRRN